MGPLANWALCLSTPKHNGKSGTGLTGSQSYSKDQVNTIYIYIHINKEDMFGRIARCEAGEAQ